MFVPAAAPAYCEAFSPSAGPADAMKPNGTMPLPERSPEAVLGFWLGPLRTAADTSRENWQHGMLRWRMGPFARSAEDQTVLQAQREWCEQMHREGLDRFFRDPAWETPKGWLAKLIILDQFPRSVYRGTSLAFMNDSITGPMARQICETGRDITEYNIVERLWIYVPLAHAEDLSIQELSIERLTRWSVDLLAEAPPERRRINQFVGWSVVKGAIEHAEALLLFGRFPHRNASMLRRHRGGEPRYLTDAMRPLWSFTQPPSPDYFALLGALCRMVDGIDEDRVTREALACLLRAAGLSPEDPASPMGVFDLAGDDIVPYPVLFRHLLLPEQAWAFNVLRQMPLVVELTNTVKGFILKDGDLSWPPKSAKHSVEQAIDIMALKALVAGGKPSGETARGVPDEAGPRDDHGSRDLLTDRAPVSAQCLSLALRNESLELERVAAALDEFADRRRFAQEARFQVQLCVEEILTYIVEHGYDDAAAHNIEVSLEMNDNRSLVIRIVDDGRELDPNSFIFQPSADTILEETVVDGLGLILVRTFVDELGYRRENGRNHVSLSMKIGG